MTDIENRLRALEDRLALIELEGRYARTFDERDGESWSALFTADGIYQSRSEGSAPPVTHIQGTDALRDFCNDAPFVGLHMLHLPELHINGDEAKSRVHLEFHGHFSAEPGTPHRKLVGFYDVIYRKVTDEWKIAHRVTTAFSRAQSTVLGYPGAAL